MITVRYQAGKRTVSFKQGKRTLTHDLTYLSRDKRNKVIEQAKAYRKRGYTGYVR